MMSQNPTHNTSHQHYHTPTQSLPTPPSPITPTPHHPNTISTHTTISNNTISANNNNTNNNTANKNPNNNDNNNNDDNNLTEATAPIVTTFHHEPLPMPSFGQIYTPYPWATSPTPNMCEKPEKDQKKSYKFVEYIGSTLPQSSQEWKSSLDGLSREAIIAKYHNLINLAEEREKEKKIRRWWTRRFVVS